MGFSEGKKSCLLIQKKRLKQLSDEAKEKYRGSRRSKERIQGLHRYPQKVGNVRELLLKDSQGISALKLYSFLAEHIDPTCGAVVADQQFLAEKLGVSRSTIIRWLST